MQISAMEKKNSTSDILNAIKVYCNDNEKRQIDQVLNAMRCYPPTKSYLTEATTNGSFFSEQPDLPTIQRKATVFAGFCLQSHTGTARNWQASYPVPAMEARSKGLTFTDAETTLLIGMLKQNMSPEEQKKADRIIQLVHTFRPH